MVAITLNIAERTSTGNAIKNMVLAMVNVICVEIISDDAEVYNAASV